jgi:hypothetical protein
MQMPLGSALAWSASIFEKDLLSSDFGRFSLAVDLGGSRGSLLRRLLARNPHARGILFDRAEHVALLRPALKGGRITCMTGDLLRSVPAGGDLYLLRSILGGRPDAECAAILRNVRAAIVPGGRLAIAELVLPDTASSQSQVRTETQYDSLLRKAGFRMLSVTAPDWPLSLIRAVAA